MEVLQKIIRYKSHHGSALKQQFADRPFSVTPGARENRQNREHISYLGVCGSVLIGLNLSVTEAWYGIVLISDGDRVCIHYKWI